MTHTPIRSSDAAAATCGLDDHAIEQLLDLARRAAQAGARPLRELFGRVVRVEIKGRAGNLVTEADHAAEEAVLELLAAETPDYAVLAEESGRRSGSGDFEWCVDPLDGTTNFAHGFPFFGTSVGLTWRSKPLLGAFAMPAMEQVFWAAPGQGAWCNGERLQVSGCSRVADALLATGFAYDRIERRDNNYAEFAWFTHRSHGVRRAGAAAADLAYVAAGRLDGFWEIGLSPWDMAAGSLLILEAGGLVSDFDGDPGYLADGRIVCGSPKIFPQLLQLVQQVHRTARAAGTPSQTGD